MSEKDEVWLPVINYEGLYSVSNLGRIRSEQKTVVYSNRTATKKMKILSPSRSAKSGYLSLTLCSKDGKHKTHYVHSIVLETFVCIRPTGMDACHCDGDKSNNAISNLRWDTRSGNHKDKLAHGTATIGEQHPMRKLNDQTVFAMRARRAEGASITQLANEFRVSRMTAFRAATGRSWSHL